MIYTVAKSSGAPSGRALAVLPALALLVYGVAFAAAALGVATPVFDDHPGQLYRLWHVVTLGPAPWAWDPGWWTGYPELQFYPPAFAYLGALLHAASLGALSVAGAYQALLWLTYLAPGATTLLALARVQGSAWRALPGAFLALTLSLWPTLMSGVEGGVHVGMAPARLAWALLPLLLAALARWSEGAGAFPARAVVPLSALIVLMHPAHLPAAVVLVALAALAAPPRGRRLATALAWLGVAALVTGFWTLPLLARLAETRALAWSEQPPLLQTLLAQPLAAVLVLLALLALARSRRGGPRAAALVAAFPGALALVVLLDAMVLEPLGLRWLPADRVLDGVWLALALAASLGWAALPWPASVRRREAVLGLAGVLALALLSLRGEALTLWPRASEWPSEAAVERGLRLPALWTALRAAPPGRVLFVRSAVPLAYGPEWWRPHTHVTALTPRETGRAIVNGTFTHPSPIAALVYRGDAGPGAITRLVERLDGESLFGRPLETLDAPTLNDYARRLGVSTIVALEDDLPRLPALADNPVFRARRSEPPFVIWRGPPIALPEPTGPGAWRIALDAGPGGWASARVAYYPLWRARAGGRALETRRGALGDLEVRAPASGAVAELAYAPGAPEIAGLVATALGVLMWLPAWRRRASPSRLLKKAAG